MTATSPLAHCAAALRAAGERTAGAVSLREVPFLAQVDVRAAPVPVEPNRWIAGEPQIIWLGPDEWLLMGAPGTQAELERRARAAVAPGWGAVTDVSDQRTAIELSGPAARELLETGCSLDLHPRAFAPGQCAQTLVARTAVVVLARHEPETYRLLVRTSFADHLARWLLDAAAELEP